MVNLHDNIKIMKKKTDKVANFRVFTASKTTTNYFCVLLALNTQCLEKFGGK